MRFPWYIGVGCQAKLEIHNVILKCHFYSSTIVLTLYLYSSHEGAVVQVEVFYKIDFLRKLAKFTGKYLWWSLCFNKVAGMQLVISYVALVAPDQKDLVTHRDVLYNKGILENVSKFTGKHLCRNLLFKVAG